MQNKIYERHYVLTPTKFGLSRQEAAAYIGIGTTKFDELVENGTMPTPRRIGSRKVWIRTEIEASLVSITGLENEPNNSWEDVL